MASTRPLLQRARAVEEDLALVGEVAEERALGDACALGDVLDGRLLEPALGVQLQRHAREAAARVRLPSTHADESSDDSG